jgi:hypothetical protein
MTDFDPIEYYHSLEALQRNVEAIAYLAHLIPDNDDINPLIRALSDSLEDSMVPVMAQGIKLSGAADAL